MFHGFRFESVQLSVRVSFLNRDHWPQSIQLSKRSQSSDTAKWEHNAKCQIGNFVDCVNRTSSEPMYVRCRSGDCLFIFFAFHFFVNQIWNCAITYHNLCTCVRHHFPHHLGSLPLCVNCVNVIMTDPTLAHHPLLDEWTAHTNTTNLRACPSLMCVRATFVCVANMIRYCV